MKRFLLFGYDKYYPCGAKGDFIADFDSLNEAMADLKINSDCEFYDILDTENGNWTDHWNKP